MKNEEQNFQIAVINFIGYSYPHLFAFAVRNEGKRSQKEGFIMKQMGVRAGMSDIIIINKNQTTAKIQFAFLELKTQKGKQSPTQKNFEKECQEFGFIYEICRDLQQVEDFLNKF